MSHIGVMISVAAASSIAATCLIKKLHVSLFVHAFFLSPSFSQPRPPIMQPTKSVCWFQPNLEGRLPTPPVLLLINPGSSIVCARCPRRLLLRPTASQHPTLTSGDWHYTTQEAWSGLRRYSSPSHTQHNGSRRQVLSRSAHCSARQVRERSPACLRVF